MKFRYIYEIDVNNTIYNFKASKKLISNPETCNQIKELMGYVFSNSIKHSTGASISKKLKYKCYGKSGLTDFDSYMVGFTDDNIVGVWVGDINNELLVNNDFKKLPKELFCNLINII